MAGHLGDVATARRMLADPEPEVRAAALGALQRAQAVRDEDVRAALADRDPTVRRRACRAAVGREGVGLVGLLVDADPLVVEAAAWALGEGAADAAVVEALSSVATRHSEEVCREAAVAALGAIGDPAGLQAVLAGTRDRPAVRRRAVIALAPFSGPEVDEALRRAATDRSWQVRQAAEELSESHP